VLPFDVFYISALSEKYSGNKNPLFKGFYRGMFFFLKSFCRKEKQSSIVYIIKNSEN
jgi:hypothetical protein